MFCLWCVQRIPQDCNLFPSQHRGQHHGTWFSPCGNRRGITSEGDQKHQEGSPRKIRRLCVWRLARGYPVLPLALEGGRQAGRRAGFTPVHRDLLWTLEKRQVENSSTLMGKLPSVAAGTLVSGLKPPRLHAKGLVKPGASSEGKGEIPLPLCCRQPILGWREGRGVSDQHPPARRNGEFLLCAQHGSCKGRWRRIEASAPPTHS